MAIRNWPQRSAVDRAFGYEVSILCVKRARVVALTPAFIGNLQHLGHGPLNDRNELYEMSLQFVAEKAVHLKRMFDVSGMNCAENIEFDAVLLH